MVVDRKAWLFADTTRGAHASATMYSLIETAKANDLEPRAYLLHILERIGAAETVEQLEALLPWNTDLPRVEKTLKAYPQGKQADLQPLTKSFEADLKALITLFRQIGPGK